MQFTPSILGKEMGMLSCQQQQQKGCSFPQKRSLSMLYTPPSKNMLLSSDVCIRVGPLFRYNCVQRMLKMTSKEIIRQRWLF